MQTTDERQRTVPMHFRNGLGQEQASGARLDFHYVSNHMTQKQAGYYLILLRTELRHRSLRKRLGVEKES